ncbi:MAG TPA: hypothetical protein VFQ53_25625 [Kofleriaceae bacterium]|nr:hypothetical protein [Kofleriaceae bacterium]
MRRVLVLVVILASAHVAHADDELARARQLEAQLEYDKALAIVERVLAAGGADPARYVDLHVFAGKLAAGLDRGQLAEDHFARALAVRPDVQLPAGTSPKIVAPFEMAKSRSEPLVVDVVIAGGIATVTAHDRLGLVTGIAVRGLDASGQSRELVERSALRIAIPTGVRAVEVAALDASGNRVWVGPAPHPAIAHDNPPVPEHPAPSRPIYARWSTWAVATGVVAAGAGAAAWRFTVAQHDWDDLDAQPNPSFSALQAIEDRGRRWGIVATVGFGLAATTAITSTILFVRSRDDEPRFVLAPGPGAGIGIAGSF